MSQNQVVTRRHKPLESFGPELLQLLLRAAVSRQEFFAELDKSAPEVAPKTSAGALAPDTRVVRTRWHTLRFSGPIAANRYVQFMRLAHRLHDLRIAMKNENHPNVKEAYRVKISTDDIRGSLVLAPHDEDLTALLGDLSNAPMAIDLIEDPLATLGRK